jgi:hypothetical protein
VVRFFTTLTGDANPTLWQRLDEVMRGRLALTFAGLLLLLALVIVLIALSARMMRRLARHKPPARSRGQSDWDRREPVDRHPPDEDHATEEL